MVASKACSLFALLLWYSINSVTNSEAEEAEDSEPDEVVILQLEKSDDENAEEETYVSVDDESILNAVFEIFKEKFKDEFNFVD